MGCPRVRDAAVPGVGGAMAKASQGEMPGAPAHKSLGLQHTMPLLLINLGGPRAGVDDRTQRPTARAKKKT